MVEALKEVMGLVKEMPHYALWILAGLLAYKVIVIGSWVSVIRLALNHIYKILSKPKEPNILKHRLEDICTGCHVGRLKKVLWDLGTGEYEKCSDGQYRNVITMEDIIFLSDAIREKKERE